MKAVVLTDDELKHLERRFGPGVRLMGPWSSDGTFGYSSVPLTAVEDAAEALDNPNLLVAVYRSADSPARTKAFIELLEISGPALIEKLVDAYRRPFVELMAGTCPAPKPLQAETSPSLVMVAAG
jgi:hypothetical protein